MCADSDLAFCNSYKDGTSTNREPRQVYKTSEVGYSQLWAQSWVTRAYVLLDRTRNEFDIKISVLLNKSKPPLAQTQVSKWNIFAISKLRYISVVHLLGEPTADIACWMLTGHQTLSGDACFVCVQSTECGTIALLYLGEPQGS